MPAKKILSRLSRLDSHDPAAAFSAGDMGLHSIEFSWRPIVICQSKAVAKSGLVGQHRLDDLVPSQGQIIAVVTTTAGGNDQLRLSQSDGQLRRCVHWLGSYISVRRSRSPH